MAVFRGPDDVLHVLFFLGFFPDSGHIVQALTFYLQNLENHLFVNVYLF